jgi:parvulin-like peptidyl-prolyl isomerase
LQIGERAYAGQPIAELAKAHSESLKAEDGGLHDWTNQGSLSCSEIDDALFRLPVGALSNIIEDQKTHAFVVVRVVERASAGVSSFQDAQGGIRDKIRDQRKQAAHHKTLADFMEKNKFRAWTIYDDMLREMEEKAKVAAKKAPPIANRIR